MVILCAHPINWTLENLFNTAARGLYLLRHIVFRRDIHWPPSYRGGDPPLGERPTGVHPAAISPFPEGHWMMIPVKVSAESGLHLRRFTNLIPWEVLGGYPGRSAPWKMTPVLSNAGSWDLVRRRILMAVASVLTFRKWVRWRELCYYYTTSVTRAYGRDFAITVEMQKYSPALY